MCKKIRGCLRSFLCKPWMAEKYPVDSLIFSWKSNYWCQKQSTYERNQEPNVRRVSSERKGEIRRGRRTPWCCHCAYPAGFCCNEFLCYWLHVRERSAGQWCHCVYKKQPPPLQQEKKTKIKSVNCFEQSWQLSYSVALVELGMMLQYVYACAWMHVHVISYLRCETNIFILKPHAAKTCDMTPLFWLVVGACGFSIMMIFFMQWLSRNRWRVVG